MGDFNIPLSSVDRLSRQKTNTEMRTFNDTSDELGLIDIYKAFHPKTADYTFFSSAHGTVYSIDHMLSHKGSLGKFKKIEIISSIFFDCNTMR